MKRHILLAVLLDVHWNQDCAAEPTGTIGGHQGSCNVFHLRNVGFCLNHFF